MRRGRASGGSWHGRILTAFRWINPPVTETLQKKNPVFVFVAMTAADPGPMPAPASLATRRVDLLYFLDVDRIHRIDPTPDVGPLDPDPV